ncbi:hypothetical protein EGW08_005186 [Elysia chlorotica]|uniref:RING-type domain-containing protein n=1 Tax=Elysia chlorotica TaxID=188477 RepID=A0A433TZM8_ELYCH|nr:hypothetical protein EGW08_005186 [Elysia chlorotica]
MWLKLCFLLLYVLLLFVLARVLEALAWCELGLPGLPSCSSQNCRLLDPVLLSVVQLKALLDQRGLSYEGVLEKSELTNLVTASGQVSVEDVEQSQMDDVPEEETNFTSGAHFIEQVEDAKDSVWLVQVTGNFQHKRGLPFWGDTRWKNVKRKMVRFGVRMGHLDCSLDSSYCHLKGWNTNFVLLALPSQHQKKASVALYNFSGSPMRDTALLRWVRDKLDEKIEHIMDFDHFTTQWQHVGSKSHLEPEVRVVLFTTRETTPLFFSALSVKFPGRVKFGLVSLDPFNRNLSRWQKFLNHSNITELPAYIVYTAESNYTYGIRHGEPYSFLGMEIFLKSLYPCLNDIFIISFCLANAISWLEPFVSNCSLVKRFKKFTWCVFKYNLMVILLWLPIIALFQMPYLDQFPLLALKGVRIFSLSHVGQILRGDYIYYINHPFFLFFTFGTYVIILTILCKKFRSEEIDGMNDWFNFSQMRTLTHLRPNDFFEPIRMGGYDLFGGLEVFGSRLSQPSLWLNSPISSDYIQHLPIWKFCPLPLGEQAQLNAKAVEASLLVEASSSPSSEDLVTSNGINFNQACQSSSNPRHCVNPDQVSTNNGDLSNENVCTATCTAKPTIPSQGFHHAVGSKPNEGQTSCSHCEKTRAEMTLTRARHQFCKTLPSLSDADQERLVPSHASPVSHNTDSSSVNPSMFCTTCSQTQCGSEIVNSPSFGDYGLGAEASNPSTTNQPSNVPDPLKNQLNSNQSPSQSPVATSKRASSNFPAGYLESYQCVICLEEYTPLVSLCGLPCGHVFHETCVISWLNRDKHFCPMCRWPSYRPHPSQGQPL